jgi:hypothetical protein
VADEPKKPSVTISTDPNRPPENPVSFNWPWSRKDPSPDAVRVSGEGPIPSRASGISRASPPEPPKRDESLRETIVRAVEDQKAHQQPPPASGHHSATSDATTTGRTLDYIGLAFILVPPEPVVAALVKGEPIHWEVALPLLFGCWLVGRDTSCRTNLAKVEAKE